MNSHVVVPYHCPVSDVAKFRCILVVACQLVAFESQMLLSLGWAQHLCNAGFRPALGHGRGGSSQYLALLGESWVSAGHVLRVQV